MRHRPLLFHLTYLQASLSDVLSLEQVPEAGRWRFMDVSSKFEAAVRALLVPAVYTRFYYIHQLWEWETSYDELSLEYPEHLLPPSHVVTQHVHRVVPRILDTNNLGVGTVCRDRHEPAPSQSML